MFLPRFGIKRLNAVKICLRKPGGGFPLKYKGGSWVMIATMPNEKNRSRAKEVFEDCFHLVFSVWPL